MLLLRSSRNGEAWCTSGSQGVGKRLLRCSISRDHHTPAAGSSSCRGSMKEPRGRGLPPPSLGLHPTPAVSPEGESFELKV